MLSHHRHSISQLEEIERNSRWENLTNDSTYANIIQNGESTIISYIPVETSIYARRHSDTENIQRLLTVSPPVQLPQPPAVPQRLRVPRSIQQRCQLDLFRARSLARGVPPPLPPRSSATNMHNKANQSQFSRDTFKKLQMVPPLPARPGFHPDPRSEAHQIPPKISSGSGQQENLGAIGPFTDIENKIVPSQNAKQQRKPIRQDAVLSPKSVSGQGQNDYSKHSIRQDSSISSDSNSSPSYISKSMETPLLPPRTPKKTKPPVTVLNAVNDGNTFNSPLTKSISTPVGLQTIVKLHNGSTMTLQHRITKDTGRSSSNQYLKSMRLKFGLVQVLMNAIVLLSIGCGLAVYFRAYPSEANTLRTVTDLPVVTTIAQIKPTKFIQKLSKPITTNPAPGICLPVIVELCLKHKIPYNYTVFPNFMGQFAQPDARAELEVYDSVIDVHCYDLSVLFLCSLYVPKCGSTGTIIRPCRSLCLEMKRRCGFFFDIFGIEIPLHIADCGMFPESADPELCVGHAEVKEAKVVEYKPGCIRGFQCDFRRCIPMEWRCDGHVDCKDQTDELNCDVCKKGMMHCGEHRCISQKHMCDGKVDCPMAQDERNCLRLSQRNGNIGRGTLEIFRPEMQKWIPACISHWDQETTGDEICAILGYASSNDSRLILGKDMTTLPLEHKPAGDIYALQLHRRHSNLLHEFASCSGNGYPTTELTCLNYICGKIRPSYAERRQLRIIGGIRSKPGDWPFLAALLGGPEDIFYCAGVLISDQWILSAAHCAGNNSDVEGRTIQLGVTRRHAHSYFGQKVKVKKVLPHPNYSFGYSHDNDVALFQLASRVTFHEHLIPVCLPPADSELLSGTMCTVIGWGKRDDSGDYAPEIHEVEVPVLNRKLCNMWLQDHDLNVTEGMLCAGYQEGGKDACQGDSGGPLLCRDKNDPHRWYVGGIVSWGIKCAHPNLPGVYASVPKYIPWIQQQIELYSD